MPDTLPGNDMFDDKKHAALVNGILETALAGKPRFVQFTTRAKANELGVYSTDVEQVLVEMAEGHLIDLTAWNGSAEERYTDWPSLSEFFYNRTDAGHVRVTILIRGERFLSRSRKPKDPAKEKRRRDSQVFEAAYDTYTIVRPIGTGGSGAVFEVVTPDGQTFALKLLHKSKTPDEKRKRFRNEIHFCMQTVSPNIIRVIESGRAQDGSLFYIMPLYPKTLRDLIKEQLPKGDHLPLYGQILDGVEAAHLRQVFHRDIKPENFLYDPLSKQIVLADFGISRFTEDELLTVVETGPKDRLANFAYAAPEQRLPGRTVDQTADIYALGLILNEIFTGQIPHGTHFRKIADAAPEFAYLDDLVEQMLHQQPAQRPQSVGEIKDELIARNHEFIRRLKLDALKKQVVPEIELNDLIVSDPIRAVEILDYHDGVLTLGLNHPVPEKWVQCFRARATQFSAVMSSANITFSRDRVYIRVDEYHLERGVQYFQQYCPVANEEYTSLVRREHQQAIEQARRELQARVRQEEATARALAKVHL